MKKDKVFKCPLCGYKSSSKAGIYKHIEKSHSSEILKDMSVPQFEFYCRTGKSEGKCVMCGKQSKWNDVTNKYNRFCKNPKCKTKYVETFKNRMINKHGTVTLLNDPDHQLKMQNNRKISGVFKFNDGNKINYMASYELDFLQFFHYFLEFPSEDIMQCPYTFTYIYEGKSHFYRPDFFIPSLNLIVEIKDADNTHPKIVAVDKVKEKLKDEVMLGLKGKYNYIKICGKDYRGFLKLLLDMKNDDFYINGVTNIDTNDNDIVLEGFIDDSKKIIELLHEKNIVKSDKDTVMNMSKLGTGKNKKNVLFITGLSGSGKSTIAKSISSYLGNKTVIFHLDYFLHKDDGEPRNHKIEQEFIKRYQSEFKTVDLNGSWEDDDYFWNIADAFIDFIVDVAETVRDRIVIIEGYQIFCERYSDYPFIVKGTSVLKSKTRQFMRKQMSGHKIKSLLRNNKHLQSYKNSNKDNIETDGELYKSLVSNKILEA